MSGRPVTRRTLLGGLGALLLLGGVERVAKAELKVDQNEFVAICRRNGGIPKRVDTNVVSCLHPGTLSTCNFKTNTCTDILWNETPDEVPTDPTASVPTKTLGVQR